MPSPAPRRPLEVLSLLPLVLAAASALVAARAIGQDPRTALPLVGLAALAVVPSLIGRAKMRRLLVSGDVDRVLGVWSGTLERVPHAPTMAPLLQATAYAAYGWVDASSRALERAARGAAWESALEQRLFVGVLLDTFWGEREAAIEKATLLNLLPVPAVGVFARRRIRALRGGLVALARVFAHQAQAGDDGALARASRASPLVHWAMRYARAALAVDEGRTGDVAPLLVGAPAWPEASAFKAYDEELRRAAAPVGAATASAH